MVPKVSERLGKQLRTKIIRKDERAVRQQLNATLPAVLELEVQASLDVAGWGGTRR